MQRRLISRFASLFLGILLGILAISPARATSWSTNHSDLWWIPSESGWGIQLVQEADVIFATMFVYDSFGIPYWYVATLNWVTGSTYSGNLVETRGPWFGNPVFNPGLVTVRVVGQMTFTANFVQSGTLNYSVDGVFVTKAIQRQTLKFDDYRGTYLGAVSWNATGCSNPALNGYSIAAIEFTMSQAANFLQVQAVANSGGGNVACTYTWNYSQSGQFGRTSGTYFCSSGESGTHTFFEMNVNFSDVRGRIQGTNNFGCSFTGHFAALLE